MKSVNEEEIISSIENKILNKNMSKNDNTFSSLIIIVNFDDKKEENTNVTLYEEEKSEIVKTNSLLTDNLVSESTIYEIISLILIDHDIILKNEVKDNKILIEFVSDLPEEIKDTVCYKKIKLILDFDNCNNLELVEVYNNYINNHLIDYIKNIEFYKKEYEKYVVSKKLKK